MTTEHPFQIAGLGIAPFQYDGMSEIIFQAYPGAPIQAGGSCDYCGTGIRNAFWIKSADGKRFKVGCDCVEKTCRPNGPIMTAVQKDAKKHTKQLKTARLQERILKVRTILDNNAALLMDTFSYGDKNRPVRNYVEFLLKNAGEAGKTKACKIVEAALPR